jgi:hypothetical protein
MLTIYYNLSNVTNFLTTEPVRELSYQAEQASNGIMFIPKFVKMTQLVSVNSYPKSKRTYMGAYTRACAHARTHTHTHTHTHTRIINGLQRNNSVLPRLTSS